ncbi:MAG: Gfo/Idh/MocA family oxidoreductase [Hyphomicrobiales bacterium]|nr:Gfo/Idh/MocA family oxidoreductase [Hyphomicrobiales bacterium]
MEPVKAAIVGLGWWGRKMTQLVQSRSDRLQFIRAVEPDPAGRDFAATEGIPLSTSLDDVLTDSDVEAVILATPHRLHGEQIAAAAAAGKHIFCEKPLALTKAEAEKAVELCRSKSLVLGMGHERRFEPPMADLLAKAAAGELGRLLQVEANFSHDRFMTLAKDNWRLDPEQAPAAGMTATGIHVTDLSVQLMGPAKDVRVICESLASDMVQGDTLSAHVHFVGGGSAYIAPTLATPFYSRFAVFGTEGWIDIRDKAHVEAPDGWIVTRGMKDMPIETTDVPAAEPVLDNLNAFATAVRGEAPYPITGEDMVNNIALLEAIVLSAKSGMVETVK